MSESNEVLRLKYDNMAVIARKGRASLFHMSCGILEVKSKFTVLLLRLLPLFIREGRKTSTKIIVPTSIRAPVSPKSCKASARRRNSERKAHTVVMFPTRSGFTMSFNALRVSGSCLRWSI